MSSNHAIKVSVIVPIYNVEAYLERCIESLVNQTLEGIEIILVNDGSPDHSQSMIDAYVKKYPNKIKGLTKENGGLSDARNYGLSYATGAYIGFVDSDDYVDVTMYEKLYEKAIASDSDIVVCGYYGIDESTNNYRYFQKGKMFEFGKSLEDNPKLLYLNAPYAWNKIYKRDLFVETGIVFPKGMIYEDIATIYPLMMYANRISKVDEGLYYYILKREGAITSTFHPSMLQMYDALARMNDLYLEVGKFKAYKEVLEFINIKHTILRFRDFPLYKDHKTQKEMIRIGFTQLHEYFPNWRKNKTFFDYYFKDKRVMRSAAKHRAVWELYRFIPNQIILAGKKGNKWIAKIKILITKKDYFNKYYYVNCCRKKEIIEKQVLFESFHGTSLNDSPFAMMQLLAKEKTFKLYFTTKKEARTTHQQLIDAYQLDVELVTIGSRKYQEVLACSKYIVNNVSFPTYFIRREGQEYLNTWHGTPLKTLGKKMANGIADMSNIQRNFLEATYLLHPNRYTMDHIMEDYNLKHLYTGKVVLEGYPRNAIFLDQEKAQAIRKEYDMGKKEVFAYMPTWRGAMSSGINEQSYEEEVHAILDAVEEVLTDNQVFYVNLHPLVQDSVSLDGYTHIRKFPTNTNSYAFLNAVDVLVTDYSSVLFDYSITKKPIVLFMYDYAMYMGERGMYMEVSELPFTKLYSLNDFLTYLTMPIRESWGDTKETYKQYEETFLKYDTTASTQHINDLFFHGICKDVTIVDYAENKNIEHTLFLAPQIKHLDDYSKLEIVSELSHPIAVFLRREFTSHTMDVLSKNYNEDFPYMVVDTQLHISFWENVRLFFCRELNIYKVNDIYKREVTRLLPNIRIQKVVNGDRTFRNNSIEKAMQEE